MSEYQGQAQVEGPTSGGEAVVATEKGKFTYGLATEREIRDLKLQRQILQDEFDSQHARIEEQNSRLLELEPAHAALATTHRIVRWSGALTSVAMAIGSGLISSDSSRGWMFGLGWGGEW